MCRSLVIHAANLLVSLIQFSSLQVKYKPPDGGMKHAFIFGPYCTVVTMNKSPLLLVQTPNVPCWVKESLLEKENRCCAKFLIQ